MNSDVDLKKVLIARTLRMTGTVCFIGVSITSSQYFEKLPPHTSPFSVLPIPTLYSMGMSVAIALGAQIWLWKFAKKK